MIILFVRWGHTIFGMGPLDYPVLLHRWARSGGYQERFWANPDMPEISKRGVAALKANARRFAANVRPIIEEIMRAGATSHNAIAAKLNERNVRTARGGIWTHAQVGAILRPFEASVVA
jgi:hypothetical protein